MVVRLLAPETRSAGFHQAFCFAHARNGERTSQLESHIFMLPPNFHHIVSETQDCDFYFQACGSIGELFSFHHVSTTCSWSRMRANIALVGITRAVPPSGWPTSEVYFPDDTGLVGRGSVDFAASCCCRTGFFGGSCASASDFIDWLESAGQ
jgi:hypothetical protein